MLPKGRLGTLLGNLHVFASAPKHGKAHRVPSLVNGTCRFKKGEFGELVDDAQVWWPYVVSHVDQTSIFTLNITRICFFGKKHQTDMCYVEIWTMWSKYTHHSSLNC